MAVGITSENRNRLLKMAGELSLLVYEWDIAEKQISVFHSRPMGRQG